MNGKVEYFEVPVDDLARAKAFYSKLFGWKFKETKGLKNYVEIDSGSPICGGMMKRKRKEQMWTNYITVNNVDASSLRLIKLGGKVFLPKTAVDGKGYFAVCADTEGNVFQLWQEDKKAKYR